eukprot:4096807-Alexandrium_andersonii.AAC.1
MVDASDCAGGHASRSPSFSGAWADDTSQTTLVVQVEPDVEARAVVIQDPGGHADSRWVPLLNFSGAEPLSLAEAVSP